MRNKTTTKALLSAGPPGEKREGTLVPVWSEIELSILRDKYPTQGSSITELANRSADSIRSKASELGIVYTGYLWTEKDKAILRAKYPTCGSNIPELLSKFSPKDINGRAQFLGVRFADYPDKWTEAELNILREQYPSKGSNIPELSCKTPSAIVHAAKRLGIKYNGRVCWTEKHEQILREKYPTCGTDIPELRTVFSVKRIRRKAQALGLHVVMCNVPWTPTEEKLIEENYTSMTADELVTLLPGRSRSSVYAYVNKRRKVKAVSQTISWRNEDVASVVTVADGYICLKCSVCGRLFIRQLDEGELFKHTTEGLPVPEGWFIPCAYRLK